jgi:putative heme-binding domain-containing protein
VLSRQEMLEEAIFQPQQRLDAAAGRQVFEQNCASCHRFGTIGSDHGLAGLNLTASPIRTSKYALLEAIMFPDRKVAPEHAATAIETTDGRTVHAIVLRETAGSVALLTREGTTADLAKSQIKSRVAQKTSLMTEAMADSMNQAQLRNLLAFLAEAPPRGTGSGQ